MISRGVLYILATLIILDLRRAVGIVSSLATKVHMLPWNQQLVVLAGLIMIGLAVVNVLLSAVADGHNNNRRSY